MDPTDRIKTEPTGRNPSQDATAKKAKRGATDHDVDLTSPNKPRKPTGKIAKRSPRPKQRETEETPTHRDGDLVGKAGRVRAGAQTSDCEPSGDGADDAEWRTGGSDRRLDGSVEIPVHSAAEIIPPMSDEEYADLLADMREHGQRQKIVVDADGRVLDGRHRLRACKELGIEPEIEPYLGVDSVAKLVCSLNLRRRHLTQSQLAAIAVELEAEIAREAREQAADRRATKHSGGDSSRATSGQVAANLPPRTATQKEAASSRGKAARITGASPRNISTAKSVREADPTLHEAIKRGDTTVHAAAQKIKKAAPTRKTRPELEIEPPKSMRVVWLMQAITPRRGREREAMRMLNDIEVALRRWEAVQRAALIEVVADHIPDDQREELEHLADRIVSVFRGE